MPTSTFSATPNNQPGKRPLLLCQQCLGSNAALRALQESVPGLDGPVTIVVTVAPGRRARVFGDA